MTEPNRIAGYDLVRVWRDRAKIENAKMQEELATVIAGCVGAFVVILVVWLAGGGQ